VIIASWTHLIVFLELQSVGGHW